jgi:hypothetical protein
VIVKYPTQRRLSATPTLSSSARHRVVGWPPLVRRCVGIADAHNSTRNREVLFLAKEIAQL